MFYFLNLVLHLTSWNNTTYNTNRNQNSNTIRRDVAAGIAILREAGGLITTANPPPNPATDPIQEVRLGSRLYLAIRPAGDVEGGETGRQAQERVVRETWKRVEGLDYSRPGA
jgi:myo-inositol-1(or 4)-monophosphatase